MLSEASLFIGCGALAGDAGGMAWGISNGGAYVVRQGGVNAAQGEADQPAAAARAEDVLDKKVEASYTRSYLSDIVGDLRARANLEVVYPLTLNRSFNFTLADKNADVKTILDKVAAAGNLDKEIKNGVVIFFQKADDKVINDLSARLQDADRWKRCGSRLGSFRNWPINASTRYSSNPPRIPDAAYSSLLDAQRSARTSARASVCRRPGQRQCRQGDQDRNR